MKLKREKCSMKRKLQGSLFLLVLSLVFSACQTKESGISKTISQPDSVLPAESEDFFQEITQQTGIDFKHSIGDDDLSNLVETVGGGAAFLDYNQDGYLDIYIGNGAFLKDLSRGKKPNMSLENRLYQNQQDGTFKDVTKKSRVGDRSYSMGVSVADYDNDGHPDIYVSNYGPNVLYHNNKDGTFADVTAKAGVGGDECSVGCVWLDYDNDGYLDLYVGNYIDFDPKYNPYYAPDGFPGPMSYDGESDKLFHNNGDGTFQDVTETTGVSKPEGRAMGVGSADYDDDGFMDIFVANDHMVNYMYHNENGKQFKDVGIMSGVAFNQAGEQTISMSVDFADYNGDGLLDLFVSDNSYCSLYQNQGNGIFIDMSHPSGIAIASGQFVGWASAFVDYDNDGDLDIFKVNGALKHLYGQEDQIFEQVRVGVFEDVSVKSGAYFNEERQGRGACFGDYDNDGDIDVYIVNLNETGVFLRNNMGNKNNWLLIRLEGTSSNRDGIGTKLKLRIGEKSMVAYKKSASGYLSQNDPRLHFGLGRNEVVDKIEVFWPSGKTQILEQVKAGQILKITEPLGKIN